MEWVLRRVPLANRVMWFRWVLGTAVGFTIGGAVALIVGVLGLEWGFMDFVCSFRGFLWPCQNSPESAVLFYVFTVLIPGSLALGGTLAAVMQVWLVLRGLVPRPGSWIVVSAAGSASYFVIASVVSFGPILLPPLTLVAFIAVVVGVGAAVGAMQWLFLRTRLPRAGWWVLGAIVTQGPVSWFTVIDPGPLDRLLGSWWDLAGLLRGVLVLVAIGVWTGGISGAILVLLVRHRLRLGAETELPLPLR